MCSVIKPAISVNFAKNNFIIIIMVTVGVGTTYIMWTYSCCLVYMILLMLVLNAVHTLVWRFVACSLLGYMCVYGMCVCVCTVSLDYITGTQVYAFHCTGGYSTTS